MIADCGQRSREESVIEIVRHLEDERLVPVIGGREILFEEPVLDRGQ